jgi:hypothetical protein
MIQGAHRPQVMRLNVRCDRGLSLLYLEDEASALWPGVVRALAGSEPLEMVLCAYVGDSFDSAVGPFERLDGPATIEGVTVCDGMPVAQSQRVRVDEALIELLEANLEDLEDWGDSFVLGRPGRFEWVAAAIPHEGMVLVQPEFGPVLSAAGYALSEEAPDWW